MNTLKKSIKYAAALLFTAALIAALLFLSGKNKSAPYSPPPPAIRVSLPVKRTIAQSITISGYVEAEAMIPVVPLVSGTILEYPVKAGQTIREGELVARIDEAPFTQQMLQAKAGYLGVQSTFERVESLFKANAATLQNYDSVRAQRDAAKAQYDLAVLQLSYARVTAPVSGTVLQAPLARGSIGSPQQAAAVIADLTKQVVRLDIPEKYFDLFSRSGIQLEARVTRPGTEGFSGRAECAAVIDTISPYIQSDAKTFKAVFRLIGDISSFRPGMYVTVTVVYQKSENMYTLPHGARKVDGSCFIYRQSDETVSLLKVENPIKDDEYFAVPPEYAQSWFVVDGVGTVFDGQKVTAADSASQGALPAQTDLPPAAAGGQLGQSAQTAPIPGGAQ